MEVEMEGWDGYLSDGWGIGKTQDGYGLGKEGIGFAKDGIGLGCSLNY